MNCAGLDGDVVHPADSEGILQECRSFLKKHREAVVSFTEHE